MQVQNANIATVNAWSLMKGIVTPSTPSDDTRDTGPSMEIEVNDNDGNQNTDDFQNETELMDIERHIDEYLDAQLFIDDAPEWAQSTTALFTEHSIEDVQSQSPRASIRDDSDQSVGEPPPKKRRKVDTVWTVSDCSSSS